MKYAGIIRNDVVNGQKVCVSFWCQGCPHHCPGCHNQHTWDYDGGIEANDEDLITLVIDLLRKNGVERNLSVLGGEPLCPENVDFVYRLVRSVKEIYPTIKIFVWTGYKLEELSEDAIKLLPFVDVLIDGRFELDKKSYTLPLRGSSNQRVIDVPESVRSGEIVLWKR